MFLTVLDKFRDIGYLIIRVGLGFMIALHGWPKIMGGMETWEGLGGAMESFGITFVPAFWGFMAAVAEFFGGIFLALGLFFRPAAFLLLTTMIVATRMHIVAGDPFIPSVSYPLELGIIFLGLFLMGPGKYALDNNLKKRR